MPRVLVVDDDPSLRQLLDTVLGDGGFEVATAEDGIDVLDRLRSWPADVLVLDLMLPSVDGLDVLRALRADDELSSLPVILLTARDREADRQAGLAAGADYYLTKPFEPDFLLATLDVAVTQADRSDPSTGARSGEYGQDFDEE